MAQLSGWNLARRPKSARAERDDKA